MDVNLNLSTENDGAAQIIKNLWPLYQHDVSAFDGAVPNHHGIFNGDDTITTLAQHVNSLDVWWQDPEALFPYLIVVDGRPAGFNLIAASSRLPQGIQANFVVHEFFVLHAYRGSSVAEQAAIQGFNQHKGTWEVITYPTHLRAIAFWRRVIRQYTTRYTTGHFSEAEVDHPWGRKVAFHFDNTV